MSWGPTRDSRLSWVGRGCGAPPCGHQSSCCSGRRHPLSGMPWGWGAQPTRHPPHSGSRLSHTSPLTIPARGLASPAGGCPVVLDTLAGLDHLPPACSVPAAGDLPPGRTWLGGRCVCPRGPSVWVDNPERLAPSLPAWLASARSAASCSPLASRRAEMPQTCQFPEPEGKEPGWGSGHLSSVLALLLISDMA